MFCWHKLTSDGNTIITCKVSQQRHWHLRYSPQFQQNAPWMTKFLVISLRISHISITRQPVPFLFLGTLEPPWIKAVRGKIILISIETHLYIFNFADLDIIIKRINLQIIHKNKDLQGSCTLSLHQVPWYMREWLYFFPPTPFDVLFWWNNIHERVRIYFYLLLLIGQCKIQTGDCRPQTFYYWVITVNRIIPEGLS